MALSNDDLEAILNALSAEGFRFIFDVKRSGEGDDLILERGEVLIVEGEDGIALKVGNGVNKVCALKGISANQLSRFSAKDSAEIQAQKLWLELQGTARMYEVISKALPQAVQEEFISQKPANFSFLMGESMSEESGLYQFMEKAPDFRGTFLRNFDHGAGVDPDGNRYGGARQRDALQEHAHQVEGTQNIMKVATGHSNVSLIHNGGNSSVISYAKAKQIIANGAGKVRVSKETRPVNNVTLMFMRTY